MTPSFLRGRIRRSWRKNNLIYGRSGRPGLSITEIIKESRKRNYAKKITPLQLWLIIFDEFLSWQISFFLTARLGINKTASGSLDHDLLRCFLVIFSKTISDLFAVRHLCEAGFDVAAKSLLRSTIEYIDIATIISIEPSICEEFIDTETNEKSNQFWTKYLRGGKRGNTARRIMRKAWVERGGLREFQDAVEFDKWLYERSDLLVMSSHPSWVGGFFSSIVLGSGDDEDWLGIFGNKGEISTRTLHEAVKHMVKFLILSSDMPFHRTEKENVIVQYDETDEFHRHTKIGRDWLILLYGRVVADPRGIDVFFPEIDISDVFPDFQDQGSGV